MAHPYMHGLSSCRKWGGLNKDYWPIHQFFDQTKAHICDARHRLLLHNDFGIETAVKVFGTVLVNSDGVEVPVIELAEQHVREDFRFLPARDEIIALYKPPTDSEEGFRSLRGAQNAVRRCGGHRDDYMFFVGFFGQFSSKNHPAPVWDLLANSFGIFLIEQAEGVMWERPSDKRLLPMRFVAEQFVMGGYNGQIPMLSTVASRFQLPLWVFDNAAALEQQFTSEQIREGRITINPIVQQHIDSLQEDA